jgi:hypothetical protein
MVGFLVGYESGNICRIYHPKTKEFKVSRDVIFSENQFFGSRLVMNKDDRDHALETLDNRSEMDIEIPVDNDRSEAGEPHNENPTNDDDPAPIIYDEIVVQPLPAPQGSIESHLAVQGQSRINGEQKPLNRYCRRRIARAFKAMLKGNWKWPRSYQEAMEAEDAKQWELAMQKELESIMKNETWTLVPRPKDAKVVKSRWVLRTKDNGLYKARFCAKGFTQRLGEDYDETFAPVAKYTSIRTLLAILAGRRKAKIHQMDVNTTFLYSLLEEIVYVEQPEGFIAPGKEDHVCLLKKALYGLKQSPRAWFHVIAEVLTDFDFKQSESDPCIWIHENTRGERTYIALYVDDLIIAGENEAEKATIKQRLSERFETKDLGIAKKFLGMEIEYGSDGSIKIHQNQYIQ